LTNPSLVPSHFKFTTKLNFSFPSCGTSELRVLHGSTLHENPGWQFIEIPNITKWVIEDRKGESECISRHRNLLTYGFFSVTGIPPFIGNSGFDNDDYFKR
jgi:hypothetical protein